MIHTLLLLAVFAAPLSASAGPSAAATSASEAVRLYDAGRYDEALPLLEALDHEGKATGALIYRLAYCYREAGDRDAEHRTLERALEVLRREANRGDDIEAPFYLVNTLRNLGRREEARQEAAKATAGVESGAVPAPRTPVEAFRLAKLYADQGRRDAAARWYGKALEGFAADPSSHPAYAAWAHTYLGDLAFLKGDHEAAARQYGAAAGSTKVSLRTLDHLAVSLVRLGRYGEAADVWKRVEQRDPANADRARYCWRLAAMAKRFAPLPDKAPDGRPWGALTKKDLEDVLKNEAQNVRKARAEAAAAEEGMDPARAKALEAHIRQARGSFVAAGLEYAVRNHPIRETAFFGGYAPLIFHENQWSLPAREEPAGKAPGKVRTGRRGRPAPGS